MATDVVLPKIGFDMEEGQITEWLVAEGAAVKEGEPLFLLESDKSNTEIEAPASGTLRILKPTGETFEVGTIIAVIE
jgi:pyruvate/2-oxoglutarate dehydrogenase complex dihydrolipoamide acyltransferase (E2) component